MAVDLSSAFDDLAEPDYWTDVAMAFAGFIGAQVLRAGFETFSGQSLPNEVYGVGVAAGGLAMDYPMVAVGGGVHSVDSLATRVGIKQSINSMIGGGN